MHKAKILFNNNLQNNYFKYKYGKFIVILSFIKMIMAIFHKLNYFF